jgi:hypothetical protein
VAPGTYYVYGRRFKAFQVRFRDISRGGLRVVTPKTREQHAAESTRTYNEVSECVCVECLRRASRAVTSLLHRARPATPRLRI